MEALTGLVGILVGWFLCDAVMQRTKEKPPMVIHEQPWTKGQTGVWPDKEIQKEKSRE